MSSTCDINTFLHYAYDPSSERSMPAPIPTVLNNLNSRRNQKKNLVNEGINSFRNGIRNKLENTTSNTHVVPLSGGLDSRAILAVLVDEVGLQNVETITYGTKNSFDRRIGTRVSNKVGVSNHVINLHPEETNWNIDKLLEIAKKSGQAIPILDSIVHEKIAEVIPDDATVWSGFMGGELSGSHLPSDTFSEWEGACAEFARSQAFSPELTASNYDPTDPLPDSPIISADKINYFEQLDFVIRQQALIKNSILQYEDVVTPFLAQPWLQYILNVPDHCRNDRLLFKNIFTKYYPEIFSLPTTANFNRPLYWPELVAKGYTGFEIIKAKLSRSVGIYEPDPLISQFPFGHAFRQDWEITKVAYELLQSVQEREVIPGKDPISIWNEHQRGSDNTDLLKSLIQVEINIRAGNVIKY
ncbi:asparagine synthase-related protein [Haloarcula marismortui]|uniref:asparagine synthase-related protein n=1 Tax=Haloarcula marismortui TaxID=2238 RepID=UPI00137770B2|nr:asparagine synthase-related protein [Haloarcula californiae]